MKFTSILALACLGLSATFVGCKKNTGNKTTCSSRLHGTSNLDTVIWYAISWSHGTISTSTGAIASSGAYPSHLTLHANGAFNSSDNCYYAFAGSGLVKITSADAITTYSPPAADQYGALTYNPVTNSLYCIRRDSVITRITLGMSSYSITAECAPTYRCGDAAMAVAPSGDMYIVSYRDSSAAGPEMSYIEKVHPGSSTTTIIGSVPAYALGLQYNTVDNMMYMLTRSVTATTEYYHLTRVDPSSGSVTVLTGTALDVNEDAFSCAIDPCSNRYIYSCADNIPTTYSLKQVDMTGTLVQNDVTSRFYSGLAVQH